MKQVEIWIPEISKNKVVLLQGWSFPSGDQFVERLLYCGAPWWRTQQGGGSAGACLNKLAVILCGADSELEWCDFPLAGRGGEERRCCYYSSSRSVKRIADPWVSWSWFVLAFKRGAGRRLRCIFGRLSWWEQKQELFVVSFFIKRCCSFFEQGERWLHLPLAGRGGEGRRSSCYSAFASGRRLSLHFRASHAVAMLAAVIFGQNGGQSSTSMAEACFDSLRRCSTPLCLQVVRPRRCSGGRRQRIFIGMETQASKTVSDLGGAIGAAWRSPAFGRGGFLGLDCFFIFSSRVFFDKSRGPVLEFWSFVREKPRDLFVNYTCLF